MHIHDFISMYTIYKDKQITIMITINQGCHSHKRPKFPDFFLTFP